MLRYIKVWLILSINSFQTFFLSRFGAVIFLTGKIVRFILYLVFLVLLVSKTKILAGYNLWQVILFYLTFNFIDSITQMLFREVYRFRQYILSGNFDLLLVKPVNSLFRILFGGTDFLDFITLLPFIIFIIIVIAQLPQISLLGLLFYLLLLINAITIAMSFHILVMALAILTLEIDHAIMIYRDFTGMGKLPVDIYGEPLRSFVTFVIPVGIMMTFPVKSLVGLLSFDAVIMAFVFGIILFIVSLTVWNYSLRQYTSASS
ncbi:ABC-2 family transporter protein [Candidatus Gottesmanbacteria bacterium]|nr:ABC-2 family transporter protein [Candidatus Gottesmanbacteria bacterium]MBI5452005.1 ABC-2 family transporter protein [Candidatus Gottesmanbacteria bacterium]